MLALPLPLWMRKMTFFAINLFFNHVLLTCYVWKNLMLLNFYYIFNYIFLIQLKVVYLNSLEMSIQTCGLPLIKVRKLALLSLFLMSFPYLPLSKFICFGHLLTILVSLGWFLNALNLY